MSRLTHKQFDKLEFEKQTVMSDNWLPHILIRHDGYKPPRHLPFLREGSQPPCPVAGGHDRNHNLL